MKIDMKRYAPVGLDLKTEKRLFGYGLLAAGLYSTSFLFRYIEVRRELYWRNGAVRRLRTDVVMPDFAELLDGSLMGFGMLAFCMLTLILFHYGCHYQNSRSIYLMRRLPDKMELHRRCLTLPVLAAAACLVLGAVMLLGYYGIYMSATPEPCLMPDQWQKIWRISG